MKALNFLIATVLTTAATTSLAAKPPSLLTPKNHTLVLIDHQPQMAFATKNIDIATLRNNTVGLAKSAKAFKVPTILTTVAAKSFSGPIFPEIQAVFPNQKPIDRTTMNTWEDDNVVKEIKALGRKKIVLAGLWTEVCIVGPALSAIADGYEVFVVEDASGGVTESAHNMAMQRMIQAGVRPDNLVAVLVELQRDWARGETYNDTMAIAKEHGGGYGLGVIYANDMFNAKEGQKQK